jgi:hypothetical protein
MQPDMKIAIGVLVLLVVAVGVWMSSRSSAPKDNTDEPNALNYDELIIPDAEDLAEQGIGRAYEKLGKDLRAHGVEPAPIEELIDTSTPDYRLRFRGVEFVIHSPRVAGSEENSWGLATYAFFSIVNQQLPENGPRFYAINGGNDLSGMFLSPDVVARARAALKERKDWPYLPTKEAPWFGQEH